MFSQLNASTNMEWCTYDPLYLESIKRIREQRRRRRKRLLAVLSIFISQSTKPKKKTSSLLKKEEHGFFEALLPILHLEDLRFHNCLRLNTIQLEKLMNLVAQDLQKQYLVGETIGVKEKLLVTLRYLASGDSLTSMSHQYMMDANIITTIVKETCDAIWAKLQPSVLPSNLKEKHWLEIAEVYDKKWNFPHCIGAIDGKHVVIQCPDNDESRYYDYKDTHSVVLLAVCDGEYVFRYVDIGGYGRRSDGGIFQESQLGEKFNNNEMNVPLPAPISANGPPFSYCLVGDDAFPLKSFLLRPYPVKGNISEEKRIFNYRQLRARKTIDDTFGILAARWRIFQKCIMMSIPVAIKIIKATVCLHNWLRLQDREDDVRNKYISDIECQSNAAVDNILNINERDQSIAFQDVTHIGSNNSTKAAIAMREQFLNYFNGEGAIDWQYDFA